LGKQGAHVVADVICGASSIGFPATKPLPLNITSKSQPKQSIPILPSLFANSWKLVAAVVLMGDPSTTKGQEFHVGSSEGDGVRQHTPFDRDYNR